jgi:hypothetical protein
MTEPPALLSGGNPQIPKGHGEAPVRAYLDAMPGWKQAVGRRLDALITAAVPEVKKAVKWNTPLYGLDGATWFTSFHCFDRYVKVAFYRGEDLTPAPPVASKVKGVRYLHIHEGEAMDEPQLSDWFAQASRLPGEKM